MRPAFALWLTGLPASGKSAIARELLKQLQARGLRPAVLESDALRAQLTPLPTYDESEREIFYAAMTELGAFLCQRGVPVIFDATANRRSFRDAARRRIARFAEIHVDTPLEICASRDPKGLYRAARAGGAATLPGVHASYEPPQKPELVIHGGIVAPAAAAQDIVSFMERGSWV